MRNRSAIALLATMLLFGAATAAYADHAYTANARAVGLTFGMQGQTLTAALTDAKIQSAPVQDGCEGSANACATAAGIAEPLGKVARASAPGNQGTKTAPASNLIPTDGTVLSQTVTGQIGQSTAVATPPERTRAKGTAGQSVVLLGLGQQVTAVQQRMRTEVPSIVNGLAATAESDPSGATRRIADGLDLIAQDPAAQPLVKIITGPALSESTDLQGKTTATAIANGAEVVIGPAASAGASRGPSLGGATPEGFVVLRISKSLATATTDQKTGAADFEPAKVTVRSLADASLGTVSVAPGQSSCFAADTPFETCVSVLPGAKRVEGAAAAATVGGVEVTTLRTQGKSAVNLRLGMVEAGANAAGRKTSATSPEASTPDRAPDPNAVAEKPSRMLPETGGMDLAVPGLALLGASGLTLALLRRRRP